MRLFYPNLTVFSHFLRKKRTNGLFKPPAPFNTLGLLLKVRLSVDAVTLLESVYTSAGVYQLLPAGVERMALGANFDLELALYGTGLEGLTASAADDAFAVRGMDILFHRATPHFIFAGRSAINRPAAAFVRTISPEQMVLYPEKLHKSRAFLPFSNLFGHISAPALDNSSVYALSYHQLIRAHKP